MWWFYWVQVCFLTATTQKAIKKKARRGGGIDIGFMACTPFPLFQKTNGFFAYAVVSKNIYPVCTMNRPSTMSTSPT